MTASDDFSHLICWATFSSDDPGIYEDVYSSLKTFIDSCLDVHKVWNQRKKQWIGRKEDDREKDENHGLHVWCALYPIVWLVLQLNIRHWLLFMCWCYPVKLPYGDGFALGCRLSCPLFCTQCSFTCIWSWSTIIMGNMVCGISTVFPLCLFPDVPVP